MNAKSGFLLCVFVVSLAALLGGCADGSDTNSGLAGTHLVELYSGGKLVRQWNSTDMPATPSSGKGYWYFTDVETERMVRVAGTIVITELERSLVTAP